MPGGPKYRIKRECTHPKARHVHGTEQAYISDVCRCDDCREAHRVRMSWRRRQYAYGRDIAHLVPAVGSARRLEALHYSGFSCPYLAKVMIGWDPATLHRIRLQPRITEVKADAIAALFDELWNKQPPMRTKSERISASITRAMARRRGYVPALAWDDDTIDDPAAKPFVDQPLVDAGFDEVAVERLVAGTLDLGKNSRAPERIEAIRRLARLGLSDVQIGERVHMKPDAVCAARIRNGIRAGQRPGRSEAA